MKEKCELPEHPGIDNPEHLVEFSETQTFKKKETIRGLIIAAIAAVLALILWKTLSFDENVNKGLAILFYVAVLWFTEAVHITVTALIVPILAALAGFPEFTTKKALSSFADPIIFIFFGGFALATALHVQKLDKKIAGWIISASGSHFGVAAIGLFSVTALLSMWISNTATAAMMLPLALGILSHVDRKKDRNTYIFVLLGIAYSASIGGMGTLVGSPPNAIAAKALNLQFSEWMVFGLPIMLVLLPTLLFTMYLVLRPNLKQKITMQKQENIPWTLRRRLTAGVFVITALAWILGEPIKEKFGITDIDSIVAISAAITVIFLGLSSWKEVSDNTDWGVLFLFGGGITLSSMLKDSGTSLALGQLVADTFGHAGPFVIILVITIFIVFWTEFTSNTASAALLVPVVAGIAVQMNLPAQVLVMIIGIGASCAFMLPVATPPNAIVFGTGMMRQKDMMRVGLYLNLVAIVIISLWGYLFLM